MNRIAFLLAAVLSACTSQEFYQANEYAREQYCKDNFQYTDPLFHACMREAELSYDESLSRLEEREESKP